MNSGWPLKFKFTGDYEKIWWFWIIWFICLIANLAIYGAIIYVIIHFVSKYW